MAEYIRRDDALQCACELLIINGGCTRCSEGKKVCDSVREAFAIIPAADVVSAEKYATVVEQMNALAGKLIKIREIAGCRNG